MQQREQLVSAGEQAGDALRQRMALHTMALGETWREQHGKLSELVQALEQRTTNLGEELEAHGKRANQVAAEGADRFGERLNEHSDRMRSLEQQAADHWRSAISNYGDSIADRVAGDRPARGRAGRCRGGAKPPAVGSRRPRGADPARPAGWPLAGLERRGRQPDPAHRRSLQPGAGAWRQAERGDRPGRRQAQGAARPPPGFRARSRGRAGAPFQRARAIDEARPAAGCRTWRSRRPARCTA